MSTFNGPSASRREFLRDVALVSAAMAGGVSFTQPAVAEPQAGGKPIAGRATKLALGLAPDATAAGAVLVLSEWGTFVTFRAMTTDEDGFQHPIGTGVVELIGCRARTFSYSTDFGDDGRPYSYFDLKSGAIFEIADSPWLLRVEEDMLGPAQVTGMAAGTTAGSKRTRLRHFVFTFHDTTFQCIAEDLETQLRTEPYGTIAASLGAGGIVAPPTVPAQQATPTTTTPTTATSTTATSTTTTPATTTPATNFTTKAMPTKTTPLKIFAQKTTPTKVAPPKVTPPKKPATRTGARR